MEQKLNSNATETDYPGDDKLLADVVVKNSQTSFAELVRRHSPMVQAACRRQLGTDGDVDDAAQAVFLILWKKASTLRSRNCIAGWLHRVARNVCRDARKAAEVRRRHERQAAAATLTAQDYQDAEQTKELLDEELDSLPEKYRLPLILFHLEGRSLDEVAALMGSKASTVGTRLARARDLLRSRLSRKGMAITGAGLGAMLASTTATNAANASFVETTAAAAKQYATGKLGGVVSAKVAALTHGASGVLLQARLWALAIRAAIVLGCVFAAIVAVEYAARHWYETKTPSRPPEAVRVVQEGLSMQLIAQQQSFAPDQPLKFQVIWKNVSPKPFRLLNPSYYWRWDLDFYPGPLRGACRLEDSNPPEIVTLQPDEELVVSLSLTKGDYVFRRVSSNTRTRGKTTTKLAWDESGKRQARKLRSPFASGNHRFRPTARFRELDDDGAIPFWSGTIRAVAVAYIVTESSD